MPRKQKHYNDRISVLAEIHGAQRKINKMMVEQERLDKEADAFFKGGKPDDGKFKREQAEKLRKSIGRIETGTLARLKQTLSALETPDLFGHTEVVLQKA